MRPEAFSKPLGTAEANPSTPPRTPRAGAGKHNDCDEAVPLSELELRYWYTRGTCTDTQVAHCYWATVGLENVLLSFSAASAPGADTTLNVNYTAAAGTLPVGGNSGQMQLQVHGAQWCLYDEADDYSYDASKTAYADWDNVTLYRNGQLVWGVEP